MPNNNIAFKDKNIFAKKNIPSENPKNISDKENFFFLIKKSQSIIKIQNNKNIHQNTIKPEKRPTSIEKKSLSVMYLGNRL